MRDIHEEARGKWAGVLAAFGVSSRLLDGKHHGCPLCGGTDRFRFDNKEGKGTYYCNGCGPGNGVKLVMELKGMDFRTAVQAIREVIGGVQPEPFKQPDDRERQRRAMEALWKRAAPLAPGDHADRYLASRGLTARPSHVRFVERCRTSTGEFHPAMVAAISGADGIPVNLHKTYLADGRKAAVATVKEVMPGPMPDGCAIRLAPPGVELGIAEGVETALAASQLFGLPVWAAVNAGRLEKWAPPPGVERVTVFGDRDAHFAGEKAAYGLAHRLAVKGLGVTVRVPESGDWADVLAGGSHGRG